jgi:stage III sporulation protein AE
VNLNGIVAMVSKVSKWLLGFTMTLFTAFLTFKQLITTAMDNVSTRAVRFTLTSLVPVVGSALADAYKTVQSSVGLLKSGVGVFVIIAVAVAFLPSLIQCGFWILSLGLCKATGEVLNMKEPCIVLNAVNTVITTVFAILLCIMSVFIISTALILMLGGGGG